MQTKKILFTGMFWDYFLKSLGLWVLTVVTFGIIIPYTLWWHAKYFVSHLEIEA